MNIFNTILLLCFALARSTQLLNRNKHRNTREMGQRNYNDELMKKNTININDRIYYNGIVTTPFIESICPIVSDLVFKDEMRLYATNQVEFHNSMIRNVSNAFLTDVYTGRNYPTHRHDVLLIVTVDDIHKYNKNHCKNEYSKLTLYKRGVSEYRTIVDKIKNDEEFIIYDYKTIVNNRTQEYMLQVYNPINFDKLHIKTENDEFNNHIDQDYYKLLYRTTYYAYLTTAIFGTVAIAIISIL